ncbi:MAG: RluA family pseudouridine synthase [Planctomycetota bacterium]
MEAETFHSLTVGADAAGERVDHWLHLQFTDLSRSALKRYIEEGRVLVNGAPPKPSTTLRAGSEVSVRIPAPPPLRPIAQEIPLAVIFEDDAILVINKGPDMVVHPSPGRSPQGTLVNALLGRPGQLSSEGGDYRPGIVHRLDRETSGLIVVARTDAAHRNLAAQFKARAVAKEYLAFAHEVPNSAEGLVDLPVGRSPTQRKKMTVRHDEQGKESQTRWRVERTLARFTWFRLFPRTGRTHQIRVHLKSLGHPIVCDALYGREKKITLSEIHGRTPKAGEEAVLDHHALHAARLSFAHPVHGQPLTFEAPLPRELQRLWDLAAD